MKVNASVVALVVVGTVLLWWRLAGRAGAAAPPPDVPLPAGATVVKSFQPLVNLNWTRVTLALTRLHPAEVDRFYRVRLPLMGWQEERISEPARGDRRPVAFVRGSWRCTIAAFPDPRSGNTNLLVQVRQSAGQTPRPQLSRQAVSGRLGGFPLYPGVEGALLIEEGDGQGPVTVLYETPAGLAQVAAFYRRRLAGGERDFPALTADSVWASGAYSHRGCPVLVNLCRRPQGGASVLVLINRAETSRVRMEVEACSGGGTW